MTGLVDVFGGSTVQPSNVAYASVALSATIPTYWPSYVTGTQQPLARLMDVIASTGGLAIKLPDATLAGLGQDVFFNNPGANTYSVQDSGGNIIATIAAGQQKYLYLSDNSTTAGTWRVTLFGVGASSPDASQLAGFGLKAIGATLNQASPVSTITANTTFAASDRAKTYVNTGGAITGTLPLTGTVSNDYFLEIRNQGTGTLTLSPQGGELIDGSASIVLQVNESCTVHAGVANYYTVGRGRNTQFNFTQLLKTVTGGTTTLSLTEASNVVQTYSGTATSNNIVVLPSVVQVYYISNQVLGGFNFQVQSPTPGSVLSIPYGQNAVVFCDGVNVINASTSVGGISSLLLLAGSLGAPSLGIAATNNGLYAPSSTTVAVSAGGVLAGTFSTNGYNGRIGGDAQFAGAFNTLSVIGTAATNLTALIGSGTTTGAQVVQLVNTSGNAVFGVEGSAGGFLSVGSSPYSTVITSKTGSIQFSANNGASLQATLSSTGLAITGTLASTGITSASSFYGTTNTAINFLDLATNNGVTVYGSGGAIPNSVRTWSNGVAITLVSSTGLAITGTVNSTGNAVLATTAGGFVSVGLAGSNDSGSALKMLGGNAALNWQISSNFFTAGVLEFTPSTAVGGSTFTTPLMKLSAATGLLVPGTVTTQTNFQGITSNGTQQFWAIHSGAGVGLKNRYMQNSNGLLYFGLANDSFGGGVDHLIVDTAGNVGITTVPIAKLHVAGGYVLAGNETNTSQTNTYFRGYGYRIGSSVYGAVSIKSAYNNSVNAGDMQFWITQSGNIEVQAAMIDNAGNLLAGVSTSTNSHRLFKASTTGTLTLEVGSTDHLFYVGDTLGANAAATCYKIAKISATGRSVNAGGTINASGADYAEYERNNGLKIIKGQIIGFRHDGVLTTVFAESIRFGVKSTSPSYVGGDTWGDEDVIGAKPNQPAESEDQTQYLSELVVWEEKLETARQLVDRIAYSGKVPCNVSGAMPGQYIVAISMPDGSIAGEAVTIPTFDQYRNAVGRVNRILPDGRCEVAVIIH